VKRSSTLISGLLEEVDGAFRAVGPREAGPALLARRHHTLAQDFPVTLVILAEQVGREVVAPAVSLAEFSVDSDFHCVLPVCAVAPAKRAR
jgi:hypothetical protein